MWKFAPLVAALAITLSACNYHVVGDSTMWQIEQVNGGHGSTQGGCGYTEEASCRIAFTPPEGDIVIAGVSVWDSQSTDFSGYREAHEYYASFGVPVVWVEVPQMFVPRSGGRSTTALVRLNEGVAEELGCELQPWTWRDPGVHENGDTGTIDGIHYTDLGAETVAFNFSHLTAADACVASVD